MSNYFAKYTKKKDTVLFQAWFKDNYYSTRACWTGDDHSQLVGYLSCYIQRELVEQLLVIHKLQHEPETPLSQKK